MKEKERPLEANENTFSSLLDCEAAAVILSFHRPKHENETGIIILWQPETEQTPDAAERET